MRVERRVLQDAGALVRELRALVAAAQSVSAPVAEIIAAVAAEGDVAIARYTARYDADPPPPLRVSAGELDAALEALATDVHAGLEVAIANVAEVAWAAVAEESEVTLAQGHHVLLREVPVGRAAIYVPGGRAAYPSTVVMGVVTARAGGVEEVVVCTPPPVDPVTLAACALTGVGEVYRVGGAQAIAALAFGTATIPAVDVIVGPGNLYVQEAKRMLSGHVGIDGFAGPSDLVVLFDAEDAGSIRLVALDLLAQAEHGDATLVLAVALSAQALDALEADLRALSAARGPIPDAACVLVLAPSSQAALELAEAFAPEHLELIGPQAELLAPRVRRAGCVFVGWPSATAFGDYVAGSNHVLPTDGSARFASGLGPAHFRRRVAEVRIDHGALAELADAGAPIALAEGYPLHAESMRARAPQIVDNRTP